MTILREQLINAFRIIAVLLFAFKLKQVKFAEKMLIFILFKPYFFYSNTRKHVNIPRMKIVSDRLFILFTGIPFWMSMADEITVHKIMI